MAVKIVVDKYDGFYMLCALDGERQVGCMTLNTSSSATDPAAPECRLATVKWVGVSPKNRGEGIATRMYEQAARLAARLGRTLASDSVFLKAGKGFWQKQEAKGRARKVGKRWILTCTPRSSLKNPGTGPIQPCPRCGRLIRVPSGRAGHGVLCDECRGRRNPTTVKRLSSGVVIVNTSPAERESVISRLVQAGFTVTNYQAGTLAIGGATSVAQVMAVLGARNPMPDEVFAGPPQPEVRLARDFFFTYAPPPSDIPWWAGGGVLENPNGLG